MDTAQAIALVSEFVRSQGLDYPSEGLRADRFEVGWSVYAPVDIDDSDPLAFLNIPVGRSIFLVGDSGRIEEVSSSIPPQRAREQFIAKEAAAAKDPRDSDEAQFMAEFHRQFSQLSTEGPPTISEFHIVGAPAGDATGGQHALDLNGDSAVAAEASRLLDPIVQQLAQLGPQGWERFSAVFAFTVSAEVAQLRFWSGDRSGLVPVPASIAQLVRAQREVAAGMPAGPWWRLLLTVTNRGEMTVDYDYGDEPFPEDQLLPAVHYRDDLETYPRARLPVWMAGYLTGPAAQGRAPRQAAARVSADNDAGRTAVLAQDIPPLPELWARWAVLAAADVGAGSDWGPRIYPGFAWYESGHRSGSTLYRLPGGRAVLSGGKLDSPLLEAAYNGGQPIPELYTGAPAWVNDSVLNPRNRNGLLTFCYWWVDGRWYRGGTDTAGELIGCIPPVFDLDVTVQTLLSQTGPDTEQQSRALLTLAYDHTATGENVVAILSNLPDADTDAAINQLSLAGLLAL